MILRRCATAFMLVFTAASLWAQTSVWKVSRGSAVVFLGGTCHLLRASDFPLPREFDMAFAASKQVIFETDIARMQSLEMQGKVLTEGMFLDGRTLQDVLTPPTWRAVREYCSKSGLPLSQMSQMKPWLFAITLAMFELQKLGVSLQGVDLHYHQLASAAGKKIGELEPFDRHLAFLTGLGAGRESEMIAKSIEDVAATPALLEKLLRAWKEGDLAKLDALMVREMRTKYPAIYKSLLADRNKAWLPKIEQMLKTAETEFVLVGVGHMPGTDGLIAQLRARGCRIEQIRRE